MTAGESPTASSDSLSSGRSGTDKIQFKFPGPRVESNISKTNTITTTQLTIDDAARTPSVTLPRHSTTPHYSTRAATDFATASYGPLQTVR
jgi:hypothetical protein